MMRLNGAQPARTTNTNEDSFRGFAPRTMLETDDVPIERLASLALREGQSTSPLYRVHRWFARRLGSQFRGMLAALSLPQVAEEEIRFWERYFDRIPLDGAVVLDPFAGGGTALVEALRCGARVIGFDVDPVAVLIARFELTAAAQGPPTAAAGKTCEETSERVLPLHTTRVSGEERQVLHHFWVELRDYTYTEEHEERDKQAREEGHLPMFTVSPEMFRRRPPEELEELLLAQERERAERYGVCTLVLASE